MSNDRTEIVIMRNSGYWAVSINSVRFGPDAGPWKSVAVINAKTEEVERILRDTNQKG